MCGLSCFAVSRQLFFRDTLPQVDISLQTYHCITQIQTYHCITQIPAGYVSTSTHAQCACYNSIARAHTTAQMHSHTRIGTHISRIHKHEHAQAHTPAGCIGTRTTSCATSYLPSRVCCTRKGAVSCRSKAVCGNPSAPGHQHTTTALMCLICGASIAKESVCQF